MKKKVSSYKIPLAIANIKGKIALFSKIEDENGAQLIYNTSINGQSFSKRNIPVSIMDKKKEIEADKIISFRTFSSDNTHTMTLEKVSQLGKVEIVSADSKDLKKWKVNLLLPIPFNTDAILVPKEKFRNKNKDKNRPKSAIYYSDKGIWAKIQDGIKNFHPSHLLATPRGDNFDFEPMIVTGVVDQNDGLFILYSCQSFVGNSVDLSLGGFTCSHKDLDKVLSRGNQLLWQGRFEKAGHFTPLGAVAVKKKIFVYWKDTRDQIVLAKISRTPIELLKTSKAIIIKGPLKRHEKNPIISPRLGYDWEVDGTFNPAAFMDEEGFIHLLYRAIGQDGISRIGYAKSKDGIHFTKRSSGPVFNPTPGFGMPNPKHVSGPARYDPLFYTSGGGWGGAEDPRSVKIHNRAYMMYVAFEGWDSIRIALTSISMDDLKDGKWKWRKPVLISPPGEINKNWLLFPEKINGKYAILHGITPNILIDYVDNLDDFDGTRYVISQRPYGGRIGFWDNMVRGAGPPPLKTSFGWLLLYHAMDRHDPNKYKLGAMILDLKNPSKVLYRTNNPLLAPEMSYENNGKPGVIYASGAVIKDNKLYIYYGGGDKVACVAVSPLSDFLDYVKEGKGPNFTFFNVAF